MWKAVYDSSYDCYYYEHSDGRESTWTRPFDYVPRAEDFEERFDEETQETVYFDKTTGKTEHARPDCLSSPSALPSPPTAMASPRGNLPPTHPPPPPNGAGLEIELAARTVPSGDAPGEESLNPLRTLTRSRGESQKDFQGGAGADLEKNLEKIQEKAAGKGFAATDAVNQDALAKSSTSFASLMSGAGAGGLLEMITIGIGFLQNLNITMGIDIPWPESFKAMLTWLEVFSLDFSVFGGAQLGVWTSIWTGLLVPIWLI